ncbi:uncharacterized protein LOC109536667 [Dendroctonus ponderosae]|uniref:Uncharacterized protein n=1 Tax=Dendroctonus ponderosae TaxID=77166 RepID=J3JXE1_DENPD
MIKLKQCLSLGSNCLKHSYRRRVPQTRAFSSQKGDIDCDDAPIKYSTSKAKDWKAKVSRAGVEDSRLWYEPYVILASLAVFLLYFCVIREENDVDKELDRSLYSRIEGLEEVQLRMTLKYNIDNGLATKDIVKRLNEIEKEKARI